MAGISSNSYLACASSMSIKMFSRLRTLHSEPRPDPEWKQTYLTGFSLVLLFFAVCLTSIQVILSMSVMGTVGVLMPYTIDENTTDNEIGHPRHHYVLWDCRGC